MKEKIVKKPAHPNVEIFPICEIRETAIARLPLSCEKKITIKKF